MSVIANRNPGTRNTAATALSRETESVSWLQIPLRATIPISPGQSRIAFGVVVALLISYLIAAPFAQIQLPLIDAFGPAVRSILLIVDLITAVLLFAQFSVQPQRAVLVIACGYFSWPLSWFSVRSRCRRVQAHVISKAIWQQRFARGGNEGQSADQGHNNHSDCQRSRMALCRA
jgi:hypothetical protein